MKYFLSPPLVGQHLHLYLSVSPVIVDLAEPLAAAAARSYRRTWGGLAVIPEEDEFIVIG